MGYLFKLQKEAQNFAETISVALKVETEIIDENYIVVGATSQFLQRYLLGYSESNAHITRHVLKTKHPMLLTDPAKNQLCQGCEIKDSCFYKAGIYYPILLNGVCHGVISLIAFDDEQKKNIIDNSYTFMKFTDAIADLLSSKIQGAIINEGLYKTDEYLSTIISAVHEGIIACDSEGDKSSLDENSNFFANIIGNSPIMQSVKSRAGAIAKSPSSVLITGESGTGKELLAKAIHNSSLRSGKPFIAINCGAIPDALLESELFGYEKGAFTGANANGKPGMFELAQGGTIFLDEIGDMPLNLQVKLLRVLQDKTIQHIGGTKSIAIDARIIAATHQDLKIKIAAKQFREDLFYRLNVIPITIPPLREHIEDILPLVDFLCNKFSRDFDCEIKGVSKEALELMCSYNWPGNVRELENAIEYAMNYSIDSEIIGLDALPTWLFSDSAENGHNDIAPVIETRKEHLEKQEKIMIERELLAEGASLEAKKKIAAKLGMNLSTLYRKIKKYSL